MGSFFLQKQMQINRNKGAYGIRTRGLPIRHNDRCKNELQILGTKKWKQWDSNPYTRWYFPSVFKGLRDSSLIPFDALGIKRTEIIKNNVQILKKEELAHMLHIPSFNLKKNLLY